MSNYCLVHKNQKVNWICLGCDKQAQFLCIFCIQNHTTCDKDLIIAFEDIEKKIVIEQEEISQEILNEIDNKANECLNEYKNELNENLSFILNNFREPKKLEKEIFSNQIQEYKKFFDLKDNSKTNRIVIQNSINDQAQDLEGDIQYFKDTMNQKINFVSQYLNFVKIYETIPFDSNNFSMNYDKLKITPYYKGIKLSKEKIQIKDYNSFFKKVKQVNKNFKENPHTYFYSKFPIDSMKLRVQFESSNFCMFIIPTRFLNNIISPYYKTINQNEIFGWKQSIPQNPISKVHFSFQRDQKDTDIKEYIIFDYNKENNLLVITSQRNKTTYQIPLKKRYHLIFELGSNEELIIERLS